MHFDSFGHQIFPANPAPVTGHLTVSDPDAGQSLFQVQSNVPAADGSGTFSLDANGNWSFQLNVQSAVVEHLAAGAHLSETFTVLSLDGSTSHDVHIDITGILEPDFFKALPISTILNPVPVTGSANPIYVGGIYNVQDLNYTLQASDFHVSDAHFMVVANPGGVPGFPVSTYPFLVEFIPGQSLVGDAGLSAPLLLTPWLENLSLTITTPGIPGVVSVTITCPVQVPESLYTASNNNVTFDSLGVFFNTVLANGSPVPQSLSYFDQSTMYNTLAGRLFMDLLVHIIQMDMRYSLEVVQMLSTSILVKTWLTQEVAMISLTSGMQRQAS